MAGRGPRAWVFPKTAGRPPRPDALDHARVLDRETADAPNPAGPFGKAAGGACPVNTPTTTLTEPADPQLLRGGQGSHAERPEGQRHALEAYTRRGRRPDKKPRRRRSLPERFWAKVDATGDCWEWTGHQQFGYGLFVVSSKPLKVAKAHRVAWELLVGPIPEGLVIDHLCRVQRCLNPAHLEVVTPAENSRRMPISLARKRRQHCPHGHPYDTANTRMHNGGRCCRTCDGIARARAKRAVA